ncbi:MAG: UDP-N-acetylmuramoyl-L-alanine--D-glutamate ligase [Clostridiaceae bacterium]|nr:UDP-N-acetylmuramoyl-L-alanine--D-glutamate ligase [Clostridiaceae bacterium]
MNFSEYLSALNGKRVAVLGVGVSNRPLVKILVEAGAEVTVCDKKSAEQLGEYMDTLKALGVRTVLGADSLDALPSLHPDVIFRTPGLRPDQTGIVRAVENGAVLTSEMEAFFDVCPCPIIAVTGSEGKTTTTTEIAGLLRRAGKTVHIGGNIGTPLFDRTPDIHPEDIVAVELSSFQLMTMKKSAHTAVVKNVTPNHLDYHRGMSEYIDAKRKVFRWQRPGDRLILNWDNEVTRAYAAEAVGDVVWFSVHDRVDEGVYLDGDTLVYAHAGKTTPVLQRSDIRLPGLLNVDNFATAIAAVYPCVPPDVYAPFAREFNGVEHRIEFVREYQGVRYYNDSIATAPTRVIAGLHAFDQKLIVIAGGYDKKIPFDALGPEFVEHVKALVLCGTTSPKIRAAVESAPGYNAQELPIIDAATFQEAVLTAKSLAHPGDVVTLSPSCAAFDQFDNFEHRGRVYKEIVRSFGE